MKYLIVFNVYSGRYYRGEFTTVYDSLEEAVKSIKENKDSITLKFKKMYIVQEEVEVNF